MLLSTVEVPGSFYPMLLNQNTDLYDYSFCRLSYNEVEHWLQAEWVGHVNPTEALRGAESYLQHAARRPSPYLLNDNERLRGPWFESLDWLSQVWLPQASQLGLRYVAHLVQADSHIDILTTHLLGPLPFELQIFQNADDARHWLRQQRDAALLPAAAPAPAATRGRHQGAAAGE